MSRNHIITLLLLLPLLFACHRKHAGHNHDHDHDHDHADHAHPTDHQHEVDDDDHGLHTFTSYSNQYEAYMKMEPSASKCDINLSIYLTDLVHNRPIVAKTISALWQSGETHEELKGLRSPLDGIYHFSLPCDIAANDGDFTISFQTNERKDQIVFQAINFNNEVNHVDVGNNEVVKFSKEKSWKVDFATDTTRKKPFGPVIKTVGQVKSSPKNEMIIAARTSGIIHFANAEIAEGSAVNTNKQLFFIESDGMADNNMTLRYHDAEAEYKKAKSDYERKVILAADKIISERELINSEMEHKKAELIYSNMKKNFFAGKQTITSPINGYIYHILVRNGEYVTEGQAILTVGTSEELIIRAELQPKLKPLLSHISTIYFKELNSPTVYSLDDVQGKILTYGKSTDDRNPLIPISFLIKNRINLTPGSFLTLYINTTTDRQALLVNNEALVEEMGRYFLFVQITPELFEKRAVIKGNSNGKETEILDGLQAGERIVSKGAIMVKLTQSTASLDTHAGHAH